MAFRFIFWGDSSQNNSLADSYTQQAESDFRTAHLTDFENFNNLSATPTIIIPDKNTPFSAPVVKDVASEVVSELIQAVTETKKIEAVSSSLGNSNEISDVKKLESGNTSGSLPIEQVKLETVEAVNSVAETIKTVSQSLNEEKIQQTDTSNPSITSANTPFSNELEELLQKMRSFLDDLRNNVLSLLEQIQKPLLQQYYGVEDAVKDDSKKMQITLKAEKRQALLEEKMRQTAIDDENKKQIKTNQVRLEKELHDQSVKKEKQTELDNLLTKRLEESRKRNLFEHKFLPK
jgi:hypothetical protein